MALACLSKTRVVVGKSPKFKGFLSHVRAAQRFRLREALDFAPTMLAWSPELGASKLVWERRV